MNHKIEDLQPGDLGWIISQHGEIYQSEFGFNTQFEVNIAQKVGRILEKEDSFTRFWICRAKSIRAGSITISKVTNEESMINFVFVSNNFRGQGIAKNLMETAMSYSIENNVNTINLETYNLLVGARKLYDKLGFKCIKETKNIKKYGQTFNQEYWQFKRNN